MWDLITKGTVFEQNLTPLLYREQPKPWQPWWAADIDFGGRNNLKFIAVFMLLDLKYSFRFIINISMHMHVQCTCTCITYSKIYTGKVCPVSIGSDSCMWKLVSHRVLWLIKIWCNSKNLNYTQTGFEPRFSGMAQNCQHWVPVPEHKPTWPWRPPLNILTYSKNWMPFLATLLAANLHLHMQMDKEPIPTNWLFVHLHI